MSAGLSAIQLFPTCWRLLPLSSRGGDAFDLQGVGGRVAVAALSRGTDARYGPGEPAHVGGSRWLVPALVDGRGVGRRLAQGRVRYLAIVTLILVVFALGAAYPFNGLPGFRLFRSPSRMFVIVGFPVALARRLCDVRLFVADGGGSLRRRAGHPRPPRDHPLRRSWRATCSAWLLLGRKNAAVPSIGLTTSTVPAMFALLKRASFARTELPWPVWIALLLVDSWATTLPLVGNPCPKPKCSKPSPSVTAICLVKPGEGRVLDRDGLLNPDGSPLGTGAHQAMLHHIEALRLHAARLHLRYKEYLQFIGGSDEPLTAFSSPLTFPVISDFPLDNRRLSICSACGSSYNPMRKPT